MTDDVDLQAITYNKEVFVGIGSLILYFQKWQDHVDNAESFELLQRIALDLQELKGDTLVFYPDLADMMDDTKAAEWLDAQKQANKKNN